MKVAEARSSEFHSKWGEPGNQQYQADLSDGELRVRALNDKFDIMLRWCDRQKAKIAAKMIVEIVKNPLVGYSQNNGASPRTTLYDELLKANWIPALIKNKCNTDCSALIAVVVNGAGVKVSKDMYTGNMRELLMNTGEFEMSMIGKDEQYMEGDILWRDGHTAMVVTEDAPETKTAKIVNCSSVYMRKDAGVNSLVATTLKAGDVVEVLDEQVVWQKIRKNGKTGYVKEKYLG